MNIYYILLLLPFIAADIYVYGPSEVRQQFEDKYGKSSHIPSSLANFGNPPYGSTMIGYVYYGEQQNQKDACGELKNINFSIDPDAYSTPILLVDRGGCSFAQKVRHAQNIGAKAVIIVDSKDEEVEKVIMSDDRSAGNLYIPSFLIKKSDGQIIKNYLTKDKPSVSLELTFKMNNPSNKVEFEIFTSSGSNLMRQFLSNFTYLANQFSQDEVEFIPHYVL